MKTIFVCRWEGYSRVKMSFNAAPTASADSSGGSQTIKNLQRCLMLDKNESSLYSRIYLSLYVDHSSH